MTRRPVGAEDKARGSSGRADVFIRAFCPGDAAALTDMVNLPGYQWGTLRPPFGTQDQIRRRVEQAGPDSLNLVALVDGQIVGDAGLEQMAGRRAHVGRIGMGVDDAWTGRGIGGALLGALLDAADNWMDLRRIELTVWTDNAPALALYRRFHFAIEGTHGDYAFRNGRYVDAYTMARLRSNPFAAEPLPRQDR